MHIGLQILERRRALGLTQGQLAERIGVTKQSVSAFEKGRSTPKSHNVELLAEALETSVEALEAGQIDAADPYQDLGVLTRHYLSLPSSDRTIIRDLCGRLATVSQRP